jgi:hypothetical protein
MKSHLLEGLPFGIAASALRRRDRILMFGREAEVLGTEPLEDFPDAVAVTIRAWRERGANAKSIKLALPRREVLLGVVLMREHVAYCAGCGQEVLIRINIAQGNLGTVFCGWCANPPLDATVVLPVTRK